MQSVAGSGLGWEGLESTGGIATRAQNPGIVSWSGETSFSIRRGPSRLTSRSCLTSLTKAWNGRPRTFQAFEHPFFSQGGWGSGEVREHLQNGPSPPLFLVYLGQNRKWLQIHLAPCSPKSLFSTEIHQQKKFFMTFLIYTQYTSDPKGLEKYSHYPDIRCLECFIAVTKWNVYIKIRGTVRCDVFTSYYGHPAWGHDVIRSQSEVS